MVREQFEEIERYVRKHRSMQHPFLDRFGEMTVEQLRLFTKEQYLLSVTLPQALAAAYSIAEDVQHDGETTPLWTLAKPLISFLDQEHWGNQEAGAHSLYLLDLSSSLEMSLRDLTHHRQFEETKTFTETRTRICREGPFLRAVAALALGNEYANAQIFPRYLEGVERIRKRTKVAISTGYFDAHVRDEISDYEKFLAMVTPFLKHRGYENALYSGTTELLEARQKWYDVLIDRLFV